jgi:hypothetical protein
VRHIRELGYIIILGLIVGAGVGYAIKVLTPVIMEAKAKRVPAKTIARG